MRVTLNATEIEILLRQDPTTQRNGGYQSLLVRLQKHTDRSTGELCSLYASRAGDRHSSGQRRRSSRNRPIPPRVAARRAASLAQG